MSGLDSVMHEQLVLNYLKFYRDRLSSHQADINGFFDDSRDMRLITQMFTKEELHDHYDALRDTTIDKLGDHLDRYTEQNLHFVKQLLLQAEGQNEDIYLRTADLEDGDLLAQLAGLNLDAAPRRAEAHSTAGDAKLHFKINELKEESERVGTRFDKLESQLRTTNEDNDDLEDDLKRLKRELGDLREDMAALPQSELARQVRECREDLVALKEQNTEALAPLRADVSKYREELAERVSEAPQFKQLHKMTQQKNRQLRELRGEL